MIDRQTLEGHWKELVRYLKKRWGEVSDYELQEARGDIQELLGLLQSKTGWTRKRIEAELDYGRRAPIAVVKPYAFRAWIVEDVYQDTVRAPRWQALVDRVQRRALMQPRSEFRQSGD